jgi:hypothetical protein
MSTMQQPIWNFEQEPWGDEEPDETSFNLRAYFDRMRDEKLQQYNPEWSDEELIEWDGNFTDEGNLLIACSERDVDPDEYRRVIAQCIEYRNRARPTLVGTKS